MNKKNTRFWTISFMFVLGLGAGWLFFVSDQPLQLTSAWPYLTTKPPTDAAGTSAPSSGRVVYRWIDESGDLVFGDKPPPNARAVSRVDVSPNVVEFQPIPVEPRPTSPVQPAPARQTTRSSTVATAGDAACARYRDDLDRLRERMRRGYRPSESNSLHEQERRLKDLIAQNC